MELSLYGFSTPFGIFTVLVTVTALKTAPEERLKAMTLTYLSLESNWAQPDGS